MGSNQQHESSAKRETGSVTGVRVGGYVLEVGADCHSYTRFAARPESENAAALGKAFAEAGEQDDLSEPVAALEELDESAAAVTDRIEHAQALFQDVLTGRFDRGFVMREIDGLLGLSERLDRSGRYEEQIRLARALHGLLATMFRWLDLIRTLRRALRSAKAVNDQAGQAWALHELGTLHLSAGHTKRAERLFREALRLERRLEAVGSCATRHNLDCARRDRFAHRIPFVKVIAALVVGAVVLAVAGIATGVALSRPHDAPQPKLEPDTLSFGVLIAGETSPPRTLTVRAGYEVLRLGRVVVDHPDEFLVDSDCPVQLAPGQICAIDVRFRPADAGPRASDLRVEVGAAGVLRTHLTGVGIAIAAASLDPPSIEFGEVELGKLSAARESTLTAGSQALRIRSISAHTSAFRVEHSCPESLAPRASCTIRVIFVPVADGRRDATLEVAAAEAAPLTSELGGTGIEPPIVRPASLVPSTVSFGETERDGPTSVRQLRLSAGSEPRRIGEITTGSGEFAFEDTCSDEIAPGASCTIEVAFRPSGSGRREATLRVELEDGAPLTSVLVGRGRATTVTPPRLTPDSLDFGETKVGERSARRELTLSAGSEPLRIAGITTGSGEFAYSENCPDELLPSAKCTIDVVFAPYVAGTKRATLEVSRVGEASLATSLLGFGTRVTPPELSPESLEFGVVEVGERSTRREVVLTAGSDDLDVEIATHSDEFVVVDDCSDSVTAGTSCRIEVVFLPAGAGTRETELLVTSDDGKHELSSLLVGTGTTATPPVLAPSALDLGEVELDNRPSRRELTLTAGSKGFRLRGIETGAPEFRAADRDCRPVLRPDESCTIVVTFLPSRSERLETRLVVGDVLGKTLSASLVGTGLEPPSVIPSKVGFGSVDLERPRSRRLRLIAGSKSLTGIVVRTDDPKRFSVQTTCGSELEPQAVCVVTVTFRPSSARPWRAMLTISLAGRDPLTVPLAGTGVQAVIELEPAALDFGSVVSEGPAQTAAKDVTITNAGSAPLVIKEIRSSSRAFSTTQCPPSLAPGESCTFTVTFSPRGARRYTATITIDANGRGPHELDVAGEGVPG